MSDNDNDDDGDDDIGDECLYIRAWLWISLEWYYTFMYLNLLLEI